jgi:hypothetical protein
MNAEFHLHDVSDGELIDRLRALAARDARLTAALLAHLAEVDHRQLYAAAGFSSLHAYCCEVLGFSDDVAWRRILAARAARRFPRIFALVADGSLHLAGVSLLKPHLTDDNHAELLAAARGKSKRAIELLVAERFPLPDAPAVVRKLPAPPAPAPPAPQLVLTPRAPVALPTAPATPPPAPVRPAVVAPTAPARYKVQFTADQATHDDLLEAQALLRHAIPSGDVAAIMGRALRLLVADLRRRRCAETRRPRTTMSDEAAAGPPPPSRDVPAALVRAVWARDGHRCAFVAADGHRCAERGFLEIHHVVPHARQGPPTLANLSLRCRRHNQYEAILAFGAEHIAQARAAQMTLL